MTRAIGQEAEDRAADHLLSLGYTLVTRRFKGRRGEIDLIALDGDIFVFVEVKLRNSEGVRPEESVGPTKAALLGMAAEEFLLKNGEVGRMTRFDVIAIDRDGLRHHVDAFRPPGARE